jgi:uncharacterized protein YcfL
MLGCFFVYDRIIDERRIKLMKKNLLIVLIMVLSLLTACSNNRVEEIENNFQLLISDTPNDIEEFEYLFITISKVRFVKADGSSIETELEETVDLTYLLGSFVYNVLDTGLEPGEYSKVELFISDIDYPNGDDVSVEVPEKLEMNTSFEIVQGETIQFVFGMDIVSKGDSESYYLLPVIWESGVVGIDIEEAKIVEN